MADENAKQAKKQERVRKNAPKDRRRSRPSERALTRMGLDKQEAAYKKRRENVAFEIKAKRKTKEPEKSPQRIKEFWRGVQKRQAEEMKKAKVSTFPAKISHVRIVTNREGEEVVKVSFAGGGSIQDTGDRIRMIHDIHRKTPSPDKIYLLMMAVKEKGWKAVEGSIPPELRDEVLKACAQAGVSLTAAETKKETEKRKDSILIEQDNSKKRNFNIESSHDFMMSEDVASFYNSILGGGIISFQKTKPNDFRSKGCKVQYQMNGKTCVVKNSETEAPVEIAVKKYIAGLFEKIDNGDALSPKEEEYIKFLADKGITAENYFYANTKIPYGKKYDNMLPRELREIRDKTRAEVEKNQEQKPDYQMELKAKERQCRFVLEKIAQGKTLSGEEKKIQTLLEKNEIRTIDDFEKADPKVLKNSVFESNKFIYVNGVLWDGKTSRPPLPTYEDVKKFSAENLSDLLLSAEAKRAMQNVDFYKKEDAGKIMEILAKEFLSEKSSQKEKACLYESAKYFGQKGIDIYLHGSPDAKQKLQNDIKKVKMVGQNVNKPPKQNRQKNKNRNNAKQAEQALKTEITYASNEPQEAVMVKMSFMKAALENPQDEAFADMNKALKELDVRSVEDFYDEKKMTKALQIGMKAYGLEAWNAVREAKGQPPLSEEAWQKRAKPAKENQAREQVAGENKVSGEKPKAKESTLSLMQKVGRPHEMSLAEKMRARGQTEDREEIADRLERMKSRTREQMPAQRKSDRGAQMDRYVHDMQGRA